MERQASGIQRVRVTLGVVCATALVACGGELASADGAHASDGAERFVRPNILLVLLDDVGAWDLAAYGANDPATTPTIDTLAAGGTVFERCWAMPLCSPSRATLLTGTYPFRTGIGNVVTPADTFGLPSTPPGFHLPDFLASHGYSTGAFGKWHVSASAVEGPWAPNRAGFDAFAGHLHNLGGGADGYFGWDKVEDGVESLATTYATTDNVDEALEWLGYEVDLAAPWFCLLAFSAAHAPFHAPPAELADPLPEDAKERDRFLAMIQAADTELGRLLASLPPGELAETIVIVTSDNGTPQTVRPPEVGLGHEKGTTYEGGVRVPLIVAGPGVPRGVLVGGGALVGVVDLWATAIELAGAAHPGGLYGHDSESLVPLFSGVASRLAKPYQYAERFGPNGLPTLEPKVEWRRAVSDGRWKLVVREGGAKDLFDLATDPTERDDQYGTGGAAGVAAAELEAALGAFGGVP